MAFTQEQLETQRDALKLAMRSGVLTTSYDGNTVTYRSISEMDRALRDVEADLAALVGTRRLRQVRVVVGRGY